MAGGRPDRRDEPNGVRRSNADDGGVAASIQHPVQQRPSFGTAILVATTASKQHTDLLPNHCGFLCIRLVPGKSQSKSAAATQGSTA